MLIFMGISCFGDSQTGVCPTIAAVPKNMRSGL